MPLVRPRFGQKRTQAVTYLLVFFCVLLADARLGHAEKSEFTAWLHKHGAFEAMDLELAEQDQTPQIMLQRAQLMLKLNRPGEAHLLLRSSPPFGDTALEAERLWLMGVAARRNGDLPEAVAAWSMALGPEPDTAAKDRLKSEQGLPVAWQDVCRLWLWRMTQTPDPDIARSTVLMLRAALVAGAAVWPDDPFWPSLSAALPPQPPAAPLQEAKPSPGLAISPQDRIAMARSMALIALGDRRGAHEVTSAIHEEKLKFCWKYLLETLTGWTPTPFAEQLRADGFPIAATFFEGLLPAQLPAASSSWLIPEPTLVAWPRIALRLSLATPQQVAEILDAELSGSEIDPLNAERLRQFSLAYALAAGDDARVDALQAELDPSRLALPLKLALILARAIPPRTFFHSAEAGPGLALAISLAEAAGLSASPLPSLPFWAQLNADDVHKAAQANPLDQPLQLAALGAAWTAEQSPGLARRIGFLFPSSPAGVEALVMLAVAAGKTGDLEASAAYLNRIEPDRVVGPARLDWLQAKAALEIELGLDERALDSYTELYRLDPARFTATKRLRFALLAQQQERHELAREVLTALWRDKDALPQAEQAETLFWLAESAEALGQQSEALRDYLRVAWRYPEENIWAATALYRAALIYERTGRVEPAKGLLAMVAKNADRKSQREQAEQKLQQLEQRGKSGKSGKNETGGTGYPF